MMISNHPLYEHYILYLDFKREQNRFSSGAYQLLKISESAFNDFKYDYENNLKFKSFINNIHFLEVRNDKINNLLNGSN